MADGGEVDLSKPCVHGPRSAHTDVKAFFDVQLRNLNFGIRHDYCRYYVRKFSMLDMLNA